MARRLSKLSLRRVVHRSTFGRLLTTVVLACLFGFHGINDAFAQTYGTVAELNARLQGDQIPVDGAVTLIVNVDDSTTWPRYVITDKTPITGDGNGVNYNLSIQKRGNGTWRLDGDSNFSAGTSNTFTVQAGTYEMMRGATLTLDGGVAAANQSFNLSSGATLNARGINTIAASTITIGSSTTFGFDLTVEANNNPILTLDGTVSGSDAASGSMNLLGFTTYPSTGSGTGIIQLLKYTYTGTAPAQGSDPSYAKPPIVADDSGGYAVNYDLTVRGEAWDDVVAAAGGRLGGNIVQDFSDLEGTGGTTTIRLEGFHSNVGEVTWRGGSGVWNATASNWTGAGSTFLHGDTATFTEAGQGTVTIQAGGIQIGEDYTHTSGRRVYGMVVSGGEYVFRNDAASIIGIDGGGSVRISGDTTEVTFQSSNLYWGGTWIESNAHVILENSVGLGTGNVTLNTGATLTFDTTPELDIFYNQISSTSGSGEMIKLGENTLRIVGTVVTDSNTTVKEGVLQKNIGQGVLTVYKDAIYEAYDANRAIAGLSDGPRIQPGNLLNGGTVDLTNQTGNLGLVMTITTARNYKFSGYITGENARIVKAGTYSQTFSGQNTYTGGTDINAGTLIGERVLADDEEELVITPFGSGTINVAESGTLQFSIGQVASVSPAVHVAIVENKITGSGTVVKTGVEADTVTYTRYDDAILCLTSSESDYTGLTNVVEGYLRITNVNATGKTSEVRLHGDRTIADSLDPSIRRLQATTVLQFQAAAAGGAIGSLSNPYDRAIRSDEYANDAEKGGNVEVLDGTTVYISGFNTAEDGTLRQSDYIGSTTVLEDANLVLTDPRGTGRTRIVDLTTETSVLTLHFTGEEEQVYDRYISGAGRLVKDGDGTAVLDYAAESTDRNDYLGTTTVSAGTLKLLYDQGTGVNDAAAEHAVTVATNAFLELAFDGNYAKSIGGDGALAKSGEGTTSVLEGFNSYTGGTYLYSGTLSFSSMDATLGGNLGTGGIYFQRGGGILQNTVAVDDLRQDVFIEAGSTATFDTRQDLAIGRNHTFWHVDDEETGLESNFLKIGDGSMTIDANTGWTGTTTVQEGWLRNNIPDNTVLIVYQATGDQSVGYFTGHADRRIAALWGDSDTTGGEVNTVAGFDLTIDYTDRDKADTFAGSITGGGNLVFVGNGNYETIEVEQNGESVTTSVLRPTTLILTGANSYTGTTTVTGTYGILIGNIAENTRLTVGETGTYRSGGSNRFIASLEGAGTVDMQRKSLYINQKDTSFEPKFTGTIENGYDLYKDGAGIQKLGGLKYSFENNVQVKRGRLVFGSEYAIISNVNIGNDLIVDANLTDAGGDVTEQVVLQLNGNTKINVGDKLNIRGTLDMHVGGSLISADSVTLGADSILNVSGIGSEDETIVIITSKTEIDDDFGSVTVAGSSATVDFLSLSVDKSDDRKQILVGQMLRWYAPEDAHGTFTLENADSSYTVGRSLRDVTGTFDPGVWDGKTLTKKGAGTLTLAAENTYTGQTRVEGGTLKLANEKATSGSSEIVLSGGSLELAFDSRNADGTWTDGLSTPITGDGGVRKTGHGSVSVLSGVNTYNGRTDVSQGALLIDGSINSAVWVASKAAFGGNGTVDNNVTFEDNSSLYWRFGSTEAESDTLHVAGNVLVGENVTVRPVTYLQGELLPSIDGWKILTYEGTMSNEFVGIDSLSNPFYDFELDHSRAGVVRISGNRLDTPRALSDIVATSAVMAQTKMYRSAFRQIGREWLSDCPVALDEIRGRMQQDGSRGQEPGFYRTAWANFVGRGGHYASTYFEDDDYDFQSYGVQAGVSLYSSCYRTFGLMFGREEAKLSNNSDKMENEDYYLGLYFGRIFSNRFDMLMYVGGGWQKNDLVRRSNGRGYGARFNGSTFNYNLEFGRRFFTEAGNTVRPYVGLDVEIVRIGSGGEKTLEGAVSNEYRRYGRTNFNQVFFKVGVEGNRNWKRIDIHGGANVSWNVGNTRPETKIYYPVADSSVVGYGEDLGSFACTLNVGMNWYITERRNTMFFLDYTADLYLDRHGNTDGHSGWLGFSWRF